jgi:hypothetical protein
MKKTVKPPTADALVDRIHGVVILGTRVLRGKIAGLAIAQISDHLGGKVSKSKIAEVLAELVATEVVAVHRIGRDLRWIDIETADDLEGEIRKATTEDIDRSLASAAKTFERLQFEFEILRDLVDEAKRNLESMEKNRDVIAWDFRNDISELADKISRAAR